MPTAMTSRKIAQLSLLVLIDHSEVGKRAAIWVKISSDMPLPMPRSVISSPSHMITPVPAVMVSTMMRMVGAEVFGTTGLAHWTPNRFCGFRASVTRVADCRTARPMVR